LAAFVSSRTAFKMFLSDRRCPAPRLRHDDRSGAADRVPT